MIGGSDVNGRQCLGLWRKSHRSRKQDEDGEYGQDVFRSHSMDQIVCGLTGSARVRFSDGGWKDIQKIHRTYSGTGNGTGNPDKTSDERRKTSDKIQKNIGRDWTKHRTNSGRDIRQVPDETSDELQMNFGRTLDRVWMDIHGC